MIDLLNFFLVATAPRLGALLLARFVFRRNPATRHAILAAGLAGVWLTPMMLAAMHFSRWRGVTMPSRIEPFVVVDDQMPPLTQSEMPLAEKTIAAPAVHNHISPPRIKTVVLMIWLVGIALLLARLFISAISAIKLCRSAKRLDLPGNPHVFTSLKVCEPLCVGLIRPIVILPDDLPNRLTANELHAVIVHESAHASRQDHLIALVQRLTSALLWPHPLIHLLGRGLAKAREESCDNHAIRFMPRAEYARLLVRLCESLRASSNASWPVAAMSGSKFPMADRIAGLLDSRRNIMTSAPRRYLIVAIALLGTITAICATARLTYAQSSQQLLTPREEAGKKIIEQFVQDISKALATMDSNAFGETIGPALADDFTIQGYGGLATKEQLMIFARWNNPHEVPGPVTISDQQLRFFGDAAIWTAKFSEDSKIDGVPMHKANFFTMVWSDRNGKWQIVHLQVLPEESPTTKPADSHAMNDQLQVMKKTLEQNIHQRDALVANMDEFKRLNLSLQLGDMFNSQLVAIEAAHVQAQLEVENDKAIYRPGDPILQNAEHQEQELDVAYRQQLKAVMAINAKRAEYRKLQGDIDQTQTYIDKIKARIDAIEFPQAP